MLRLVTTVCFASIFFTGCTAVFGSYSFDDEDAGTAMDAGPGPIEAGVDAGGRDAGSFDAAGTDAAGFDAGDFDDAGVDAGVVPPPPDPRRYVISPPTRVRDAIELSGGVLVVGSTEPLTGRSREGVAMLYRPDGTVEWANQLGSTFSDQLTAVASRGGVTLMVGGTRGFSGGAPTNDQALIVEATPTGLGRAWAYGTPAEELLWSIIDGGAIAEWIGLGYYESGGDRDGLVVAFDSNVNPLWAAQLALSEDEELFDGVVIGDTVYVTGTTGDPAGADTHMLVAAVDDSSVRWARRSTMRRGAMGVSIAEDPSDGSLVVTGGLGFGSPAMVRLTTAGEVSGSYVDLLGDRATNVTFGAGAPMVVAAQFNGGSFDVSIANTVTSASARLGNGTSTTGYLRTPVVRVGAVDRLVLEGPSMSVQDVPFNTVPMTGCTVSSGMVGLRAVEATALETVTLSRTARTFSGGTITLPSGAAMVTVENGCGP